MKPILKYIHVQSGESLEDFNPEISDNFWNLFSIGIEFEGVEGHNDYWFQIGTPRAFEHKIQNEGPIWGRHYMIVNSFDATEIKNHIEKKIVECARSNEEETLLVLSRFFHWEFEDYQV